MQIIPLNLDSVLLLLYNSKLAYFNARLWNNQVRSRRPIGVFR